MDKERATLVVRNLDALIRSIDHEICQPLKSGSLGEEELREVARQVREVWLWIIDDLQEPLWRQYPELGPREGRTIRPFTAPTILAQSPWWPPPRRLYDQASPPLPRVPFEHTRQWIRIHWFQVQVRNDPQLSALRDQASRSRVAQTKPP